MSDAQIELFHAINDSDSATVRLQIVELGIAEKIRFRNVTYDEVKTDFAAHGGTHTPALWDGTNLVEGKDAVLARLATIA
jgi:hypothetical protein